MAFYFWIVNLPYNRFEHEAFDRSRGVSKTRFEAEFSRLNGFAGGAGAPLDEISRSSDVGWNPFDQPRGFDCKAW